MSRKNGNTVNSRWYGYMEYTVSTTATTVTVKVTEVGMHCSANDYKSTNVSAKLTGTSTYSTSGKTAGGNTGSDYGLLTADRTFTYTRGTSDSTKSISFSVTCGGSTAPGTSSGSISVSVPAAYTAPTVKCRAYRVSADARGFYPEVDPSGTRGYFEVVLTGGKNWSVSSGHALTINGVSCELEKDFVGNVWYGYTEADALPASTRATATAQIKISAAGSDKTITATTYIAPISNLIDIAPNCVAIGKSATEGYEEMTFEVGCDTYMKGHKTPIGSTYAADFEPTTSGKGNISTTWVSETGAALTLSPGTWIVKAHAYFKGYTTYNGSTSSTAGARRVRIGYKYTDTRGSGTTTGSTVASYSPAGNVCGVQTVLLREITREVQYYPEVYSQNQVGLDNVRMEAVRIV